MNSTLIRNIGASYDAPWRLIALASLASLAGLALALVQGWPLWGIALAMLIPWAPAFTLRTAWMYHHYGWLALYYALVVGQGGHFLEHVAQMVQIHVFGLSGLQARGVFGALDIEWVHFIWNTGVLVAVVLLLSRFRRNPWLWLGFLFAGWHQIEHTFIMAVYLTTGVAGTPGLLAQGGAIGGGLLLTRADLHFYYNLIETTPLVIGFIGQLRALRQQSR